MNLDRKILNAASEKYMCYQQSSFTNNAKPKVNLNRIETNNVKIPRLIKRYVSIYKEIQFKQLYLFEALKKKVFSRFFCEHLSTYFFLHNGGCMTIQTNQHFLKVLRGER